MKTITTTKIELKLYKKHITLSAEHKNANVFCTAYEFISLFFSSLYPIPPPQNPEFE